MPRPGFEPSTQACALTGNWTHYLSFCGAMLQPTEPLRPGLDSLADSWENAVWSWVKGSHDSNLCGHSLGFLLVEQLKDAALKPYSNPPHQKKQQPWGYLLASVRLLTEALTAFNCSEEVSGLLHSPPLCVRAWTRSPWEIMRYCSYVTRCFCSKLIWGDGVGWDSYIKQSFGDLSLLFTCYR